MKVAQVTSALCLRLFILYLQVPGGTSQTTANNTTTTSNATPVTAASTGSTTQAILTTLGVPLRPQEQSGVGFGGIIGIGIAVAVTSVLLMWAGCFFGVGRFFA